MVRQDASYVGDATQVAGWWLRRRRRWQLRLHAKEIWAAGCLGAFYCRRCWERRGVRLKLNLRELRVVTNATELMNDPELHEVHYAYVRDIADRVGLPPDAVEPVFREMLQTLAADATVETYVVLLAAKKTLSKLRSATGSGSYLP